MTSISTVGHSIIRSKSSRDPTRASRGALLDVRRFPASRKWPHFNAESLVRSLPPAGIEYVGMPELVVGERPFRFTAHGMAR